MSSLPSPSPFASALVTLDRVAAQTPDGNTLFSGLSLAFGRERTGIVGRNGAGKTTLFRLIKKELALEGGEISMPSRARIGGVAQEVPSSSTSLLDTVLAADTERAALMAEAETAHDPHRIAAKRPRLVYLLLRCRHGHENRAFDPEMLAGKRHTLRMIARRSTDKRRLPRIAQPHLAHRREGPAQLIAAHRGKIFALQPNLGPVAPRQIIVALQRRARK